MKLTRYAALLVTLSIGISGAALAQPKIKLQVVGNIGITTQYKELEAPFWLQQIPEATDGMVTASIKPWNEMGLKGPEVYRMLRQGLFDVGMTQLGFAAGDNAINDATDLAGVSPDIETFWEVTQKFRPHLANYYEQQMNIKTMGMLSYQAQVLFCRKEIGGLTDLKGRKVRTSGASQADFVSYFGGSGVSMVFGEVQQSLQSGVIDCAITGTLSGYKAKWYEGAKYLYAMPINFGASMAGINLDTWNKFDTTTQNILQEEYKKLEQDAYQMNIRENEIGIACNTGGQCPEGPAANMILAEPSPADLELRKKALLELVLPRWAERCGTACVNAWNETVGQVTGLSARAP